MDFIRYYFLSSSFRIPLTSTKASKKASTSETGWESCRPRRPKKRGRTASTGIRKSPCLAQDMMEERKPYPMD
ncbi:MAG: hypothetical protein LUG93_05375 [Lachnospiraceae bacterium]|nr:hypothetical protein [Lachnospiraceae bacterium]